MVRITSHLDMTSAIYHGSKAGNQTKQKAFGKKNMLMDLCASALLIPLI